MFSFHQGLGGPERRGLAGVTVRGRCVPAAAQAHPGPPPHQLGVQVEGTGEQQHSGLPVPLLQALMAFMAAGGTRAQAKGLFLTLAYSWGCGRVLGGGVGLGWTEEGGIGPGRGGWPS